MPEGDTIFRSARALNKALAGATVTGFETAYSSLLRVHDDTPVTGRVIEKVESRGKWLLIYFSGDLILVTHMLMSGSWHIYRTGERWRRGRQHMRAVIRTKDFEAVAFDVLDHAGRDQLGCGIDHTANDALGRNMCADDAVRIHAPDTGSGQSCAVAIEIPIRDTVLHRHHDRVRAEHSRHLRCDRLDLMRLDRENDQILHPGLGVIVGGAHARLLLGSVGRDQAHAAGMKRLEVLATSDESNLVPPERETQTDKGADGAGADDCNLHGRSI